MLETTSNGHLENLHDKYYKRITKRVEKQNGPAKILIWRTSMTALEVLDELADIPFEKLTSSLYFISLDLDTKELTRRYEAVLELAGAVPDKFIDSLHKDLNSISDFVKKNHLLPELFEMIAVCDQVRYNCLRKTDSWDNSTIHIMNAY